MAFIQAQIPVAKVEAFTRLKDALAQTLSPAQVEKFLQVADGTGLRIRDFEGLLGKSVFDKVVAPQGGAQSLYQQLPASDQGQIREFYLSQIEEVAPTLRGKYRKLYQYS
ncbi:MAG TPA: hypothetical protein VMZ25_00635 [Terriglobales bacterium]|nr:hypothetical protein [Terriglobales bacterium]